MANYAELAWKAIEKIPVLFSKPDYLSNVLLGQIFKQHICTSFFFRKYKISFMN